MTLSPTIRTGSETDYAKLGEVMFDAVRNGRSAYSPEQLKAWVPQIPSGPDWSKRLAVQAIFVAEMDDEILGFMSLAESGYIDLAFVRPKYQGKGLFRRLYLRLEQTACARGERRLWVHASLTAQPAFVAVGFEVVEQQQVELRGQSFLRFKMEKSL